MLPCQQGWFLLEAGEDAFPCPFQLPEAPACSLWPTAPSFIFKASGAASSKSASVITWPSLPVTPPASLFEDGCDYIRHTG